MGQNGQSRSLTGQKYQLHVPNSFKLPVHIYLFPSSVENRANNASRTSLRNLISSSQLSPSPKRSTLSSVSCTFSGLARHCNKANKSSVEKKHPFSCIIFNKYFVTLQYFLHSFCPLLNPLEILLSQIFGIKNILNTS